MAGEDRLQRLIFPVLGGGYSHAAPHRAIQPGGPGGLVWRDCRNFRFHDGLASRVAGVHAYEFAGNVPGIPLNPTGQILFLRQFIVSPGDYTGTRDSAGSVVTVMITTTQLFIQRLSDHLWFGYNFPCWPDETANLDRSQLTVRVFNGDLYICGTGMLRSFALGGLSSAIVKIPDIFGTPGAMVPLVAGMGTDPPLSGVDQLDTERFLGLEVLQDGRLVMLGGLYSSSPSVQRYYNRLHFSSHLDNAVWLTEPGGWLDIVAKDSAPTALNALGWNLTVHYEDGIVMAQQTGSDRYPLALQPTAASKGAFFPQSIKSVNGMQLYVDSDFNVRAFNGQSDRVVSTALSELLRYEWEKGNIPDRGTIANTPYTRPGELAKDELFVWVDRYRSEYHIGGISAYLDSIGAGDPPEPRNNLILAINYDGGPNYIYTLEKRLCAAGDELFKDPWAFDSPLNLDRRLGHALVGWSTGVTHEIGMLTEHRAYDYDDFTSSVYYAESFHRSTYDEFYLETDDLDFGQPGFNKTISHLTLWMHSDLAYSGVVTPPLPSISVKASRDRGLTWTTETVTPTQMDLGERMFHFFFAPKAGEKWRFRIQVDVTLTDASQPWYGFGAFQPYKFSRMAVYYQLQGEVEPILIPGGSF